MHGWSSGPAPVPVRPGLPPTYGGVEDPDDRYRCAGTGKKVLSAGAERDPAERIRDFLGRAVGLDAALARDGVR
jgi:hypothetical protein